MGDKKCTRHFSGNPERRNSLGRRRHIINVLGLDRTESPKMKLLMGLLYIKTQNVTNDYGKSVE